MSTPRILPPEEPPRMTRAVMGIAVAAVGLLVVIAVVYSVKIAVLGMAVVAALAAVMRAFAPSQWQFGVRRRSVDVTILLLLAGSLTILGLTTVLD